MSRPMPRLTQLHSLGMPTEPPTLPLSCLRCLQYPHLLHGAIAASAPIWNFMGEVRA